jgi:hypothetical protein
MSVGIHPMSEEQHRLYDALLQDGEIFFYVGRQVRGPLAHVVVFSKEEGRFAVGPLPTLRALLPEPSAVSIPGLVPVVRVTKTREEDGVSLTLRLERLSTTAIQQLGAAGTLILKDYTMHEEQEAH